MSDIKESIVNMTKTVTKTSGGFIKTAKISIQLANEESALKSVYAEIGKKVHEIYSYGGSLGGVFDEKYKQLIEIEERIKTLRVLLDQAKGTKTCPHCGKVANKDAGFCPKCGKAMSGDSPKPSPGEPPYDFDPHDPAHCDSAPLDSTHNDYDSTNYDSANGFVAAAPQPPQENNPAYKVCSICGAKSDKTERFCLSCGRVL